MTCIGTPISWLRLETYALDRADMSVAEHLATCEACAACMAEIHADDVALPPLRAAAKPERRWLRWFVPAMTAAVAAAIVLVIVRPRAQPDARDQVTTIKGAGEIVLGVVRERAGTVRSGVLTYRAGDRWKVVITCGAGTFVWADVAVIDSRGADYPLGPTQLACGNEVMMPGAFSITGHDDNLVCARLDTAVIPARTLPHPGDPGVACVTLRPE